MWGKRYNCEPMHFLSSGNQQILQAERVKIGGHIMTEDEGDRRNKL